MSGCRGDPLADAGGVVELRISVVLVLPAIILSIALTIELGLTPLIFPLINASVIFWGRIL